MVSVLQKNVKRPDWTRLLNTKFVESTEIKSSFDCIHLSCEVNTGHISTVEHVPKAVIYTLLTHIITLRMVQY